MTTRADRFVLTCMFAVACALAIFGALMFAWFAQRTPHHPLDTLFALLWLAQCTFEILIAHWLLRPLRETFLSQ